jgi:thioredoxin 1
MNTRARVAVLALVGLGAACAVALREQPAGPVVAEASASAAGSAARATGPRIVELGSTSCKSCKAMHEELAQLRVECGGSIAVEEIDVWKDEEAGERHGIRTIPTQIFFDEQGREFDRHMGFISRAAIKSRFMLAGMECKP